MKKRFTLFMLAAILLGSSALAFVSCEKESSKRGCARDHATVESEQPIQLGQRFIGTDEELIDALSLIGQNEIIIVSLGKKENEVYWTYFSKDDKTIKFVPAKVPVCEGGGIEFLKCCKAYMDKGKCLVIYSTGNNSYAANLVGCP